uniref:UPAR/Ly6 domain-containing protein n=1 Tax=Lates calcarifer TaxID=8187 RepID=A0A4W6CRU5_LATCA
MCLCVCVWLYIRVDIHQLGLHWPLTFILLTTVVVLPALTLDSLLCNYCPLQYKGKSCTNITSQCLPDQRCSSSRGHFGSLHVLSAQGCLDSELCDSHEIISYRGVKYNISHTCCCKDKCNGSPKSDISLKNFTLLCVVFLPPLSTSPALSTLNVIISSNYQHLCND